MSKNKNQDIEIRTKELVEFLENVVFNGRPVTLEQLKAANSLLDRSLPKLTSMKVSSDEENGGFTINLKTDF